MPFIEYENDNLPLLHLPYAFKRRLIQLSPLANSTTISTAWSDLGTVSHHRRECLHKVFITDDKNVCKFAREELNNFIHILDVDWIRYFSDSPFTIDPTWQSVILVDEIVAKNQSFVVDDTLVLYFTSTESYDRLIPLMIRSYSRLVIYGQFSWAQVKHLIHDKVKKVRIMGKVEVKHKEYNDVVRFMLRFARGIDYK
uniref:F-box domain-containing protein n=1 Tax=Panagrellus redivivus TaxID=6233 RepID=A0A7E4V1F3_PANRE